MNEDMVPTEEMETMQQYTVNDFCRLCANIDDNMVPIYADEGADHMLEIKIKTHLPFINICNTDLLPKRICYHCASAVLVWHELYESSSEADQKLRNIFEDSSYDQSNSKTVPFDDIEGMEVPVKDFITEPIEYEEIADVNIFNKHDKTDKTLNEFDKVSSSSHTSDILNHEDKSSVIQEDERLNPDIKSDDMAMFDREVNDDGSEDGGGSMYLNAAGIDDDMNGLMDCHRLDDISTSDVCNGLDPKHEYVEENVEETVDETMDEITDIATEHVIDVIDDDHESVCDVSPNASVPHGITAITMTRRQGRTYKTIRHVKVELGDGNHDHDGDGDDDGRVDNDLEDLDEEEEVEDDEEEEEDEGRPVSLEVRQLYISASNERGMQQETMCDICATVFKTRYNLLRHYQKRHPEFKMYECDLCRISYPSIEEFKDHLEERHSKMHTTPSPETKQVRFACDVCGNMYKNKASAMNHLLTHTAKKTVRCTQCDFTCYTKQQLGVHQTKHDKRFVCDICHKRFAQKSQLDVHVNAVHYNQRPFSCVLCKKTFKTKGSHDAHMVVHTDTRNYQCPHCDKKCRKRYDLTLHIRTHTGEKPFKCSVCGRGFVQMCDTRKHEMLHFKPGKRKNLLYSSSDAGASVDDE